MRITYITASAGNMHCGACARDVHLVRALIARGHDVLLVPLYTPIMRSDAPLPQPTPTFLGGVNVYFQQVGGILGRLPRGLEQLLDHPALLRLAARFAISTRPQSLGPMTCSVLAGPEGNQRREFDKLLAFLAAQPRPDILNLTNALLGAVAPAFRARFPRTPVACALQGEDAFVADLPPPWRDRARGLMRENAAAIDLFIAPSADYADGMAAFLDVPRDRIAVVPPGLDAHLYPPLETRRRSPFTVAYVSRIAPGKGLDLLVHALDRLNRQGRDVRLRAAGKVVDRAFLRRLRRDIRRAGLTPRIQLLGEVALQAKLDLLRTASLFALPSRYSETRGMAALEALCAGLPAALPGIGIFPELARTTGGVLLFPPGDAGALANRIAHAIDHPEEADRMGRTAAERVREHYSHHGMADRTETLYTRLISAR
jgi:glycosyltransferase involved in cell wall biosynthesis